MFTTECGALNATNVGARTNATLKFQQPSKRARMADYKNISEMPANLRSSFGDYGPQLYDGYCGEPVAWGHKLLARLDEDRWRQASAYGELECAHETGDWFLITKVLAPNEARTQYGEVADLELGPRGGFKSVTYGTKKFGSKRLDPRK
jgi:hypothetical protein